MSAGKKAGMDMTQGTIWNKILLFALPLEIGRAHV